MSFRRSLMFVYAAHGLNGLLGVAAVPVALASLGVSGYGLLSVYMLLAGYVGLADLGIGKNLIRLLSGTDGQEARERHIRVALGLYSVLIGFWFAVLPLLAIAMPRYVFPVPAEQGAALQAMVLLVVVEFALAAPASMMQTNCVALQRFDRYARFSFVSGVLRNGVLIAAAIGFGSPVAVAAVLVSRRVVESFVAARFLGGLPLRWWIPIYDFRASRVMLRQSMGLSTAQVLQWTTMSAGSVLVNATFGLHGLGIYRAAFDLAGKIAFVSNGVSLVVFPRAARFFASSALCNASATVLASVHRVSIGFYAAFGAVAGVAAPLVLPAIGVTDAGAVALFVLLIVALSFNAHSLLSNEFLQAAGKYRHSNYFNLFALVTLIMAFYALMPFAGVLAIGWAWIVAAVAAACFGDGLLLGISGASAVQQAGSVFAKLAAAFGCLAIAAPQSTALACGGAGILLALSIVAIRDIRPLMRRGPIVQRMENSAARPVCV